MSDSVQPHRRQPTKLCHPWDSPAKNNGVGCHFLLQCMKVKSESEVAQLRPTLCNPMDCSLPGSSVHGIFLARVLEWVAIAFSNVWIWANVKHLRCFFTLNPIICLFYHHFFFILKFTHSRQHFLIVQKKIFSKISVVIEVYFILPFCPEEETVTICYLKKKEYWSKRLNWISKCESMLSQLH